ncbi:hypothetical protein Dimus_018528 [Dionaea muscipula]
MSVIHLKKKDIVKSKVRGIEIEFDHEKLATIAARRVKSEKLKPFQRFIQFLVMKNVFPEVRKKGHLKLLGSHIHGPLDVEEKD